MSAIAWLRERLGLAPVEEVIGHKRVPVHPHTFWYYWGGITLFLFCVQVVTGVLLVLYYRPSADEAYESVKFLMTTVSFGWLIRSIHSWSANLMIGAAFVHMFSTFLMKAYRPPREVTWVTGFLLLVLALAFGFSGYLLPWNQLAFFATKVGTDIVGAVPLIGPFFLKVLRGGDQITGGTLTRFFGFHVAILPLCITAVLGIHIWLVQWHGMSVPPGQEAAPRREMKFLPDFLLRDLVGWLAALGALALLAALFPWELGLKADPFAPAPLGIKPEWYFGFMFQTLRMIPAHVLGMEGELLGIVGFGLVGVVWALVPFLDSRDGRGPRARFWTAVGLVGIVYIIIFTLLVYRGPKPT